MADPVESSIDPSSPPTMLGSDEPQLAQQTPANRRPQTPPLEPPYLARLKAEPGRGYGSAPQALIERGLTADEKRANRAAALHELARQPLALASKDAALPDDWERTKPSEVVDDLRRAAWRHGVPLMEFARAMYQEGKFNEIPLIMQSSDQSKPVGPAQMKGGTLTLLKNMARARGDTARVRELEGYSLANRAQAFDAAAEYLAYQRRRMGSWPAAFGGYNVGDNLMADWLNGLDHSDDSNRYPRDPSVAPRSWNEMKKYLQFVFHGAPDEPPAYRIYDYRDPEETFRVPPPIERSRDTPDPWRIPQDTRQNP